MRDYIARSHWADGVYCLHCGRTEQNKRLEGKSQRPGLFQYGDCRQQFTVTVGAVFERSKVPLNKWLLATFLMASSKKGISAHQLHRTIGVTYKTAWFMFHRIRGTMHNDSPITFVSGGGVVEVDETIIRREPGKQMKAAYHHKMKVLALVDRNTKQARTVVVDDLKTEPRHADPAKEHGPRSPHIHRRGPSLSPPGPCDFLRTRVSGAQQPCLMFRRCRPRQWNR